MLHLSPSQTSVLQISLTGLFFAGVFQKYFTRRSFKSRLSNQTVFQMPNILLVVATIATLTAAQNLTTGCVGSSLYGYYGANCTEGTPASQTQNITSELSGVYSFLGGYTCTNKTVSSYSKIKNCR